MAETKKVKVVLHKGKSYQVDGKNVTGEVMVEKKEAERLVDKLKIASYPKKASS